MVLHTRKVEQMGGGAGPTPAVKKSSAESDLIIDSNTQSTHVFLLFFLFDRELDGWLVLVLLRFDHPLE